MMFVRVVFALALVGSFSCAGGVPFPWPRGSAPVVAEHTQVQTLASTEVALVRQVSRPTRANLDWAAYHHNVMIRAPMPEVIPPPSAALPEEVFGGLLDNLWGSLDETSLSDEERRQPLAFSPLVDYLAKWKYEVTGGLEDVRAAVRGERWGGGGGPHIVRQRAIAAFVHQGESGSELWIEIELEPWMHDFADAPDSDADGAAELYGRVRPDLVSTEIFARIAEDYVGHEMTQSEVLIWANELGSYWYPSYNTDLVEAGPAWPDASTESEIVATLAGKTFVPTVVMQGKPEGSPIYTVFVVEGMTAVGAQTGSGDVASGGSVSANTDALRERIALETKVHGGSFTAWQKELQPFHAVVQKALKDRDPSLKAFEGKEGFLFFRASLTQMVGGDFRAQAKGKDPFPVIVEFKEILEKRGVDFLFVPVPTKAAIYPDKLEGGAELVGEVVTPFERKLLAELADAGVEVVDLLTPMLAARKEGADLYLAQDTHWTSEGLQLAAAEIASRVRAYPWYNEAAAKPVSYTVEEKSFTEKGDLPSRLSSKEQKAYKPQKLVGHQVMLEDGTLYEDEFDSRITILGDSFTGVYQRTFCRNAGVSAHIAKELGMPVDLVMSYGGGPNVRKKIMRRGADALGEERLIIWIMAARDLYGYWEDWELLGIE